VESTIIHASILLRMNRDNVRPPYLWSGTTRFAQRCKKKYIIRGYDPSSRDAAGFRDGVYDPFNCRSIVDFEPYKDCQLKPQENLKLHPREDGSIHPGDLAAYGRLYELGWKMQEGGVLYWIGEGREFWNCMLNYHSPAGTFGLKDIDALYKRLQEEGYPKKIIPCMFFGRESGCLDLFCPFLHDRQAVQESRARIIKRRYEILQVTPTVRHIHERERLILERETGDDMRARKAFINSGKLDREIKGDKGYCNNLRCLKPWKESEAVSPLQRCGRCKIALYCSTGCQKADWKRHKKEPCEPLDDIVANDDLWDPFNDRRGTGRLKVDWGDGMGSQ